MHLQPPSLRTIFEIKSRQHLDSNRRAQITDLHGELETSAHAVNVLWTPERDLELFMRREILYPSVALYSVREQLGVTFEEQRVGKITTFRAAGLEAPSLKFLLSTVIQPQQT